MPWSSVLAGVWLPVLVVGVSVSLAVLDLYAIEPPRPGDRPGAVKRALLGQSLVLMAILVGGGIHTAMHAAAAEQALTEDRAAWAAEMRAVEARSTGLSIVVTILDVTLGETTDNGRIVFHLTLDVRVRSTTSIRQAREDLANQVIWLEPPQAPYVEITDEYPSDAHRRGPRQDVPSRSAHCQIQCRPGPADDGAVGDHAAPHRARLKLGIADRSPGDDHLHGS